MQVLKLIRQHNCPFEYPLAEEVGFGSDGQVFNLANDPDKVIKLCVLYEQDTDVDEQYRTIKRVLDHMERERPPAYVHVYEDGYLGSFSRSTVDGEQRFVLYFYVMDKLQHLSDDEKKVFHTILSHEDRGIEKDFEPEKVREMLNGMQRGLDFSVEKVILFLGRIERSEIVQTDTHQRNVMQDNNGDFRFVDLDRCIIRRNDNGKTES